MSDADALALLCDIDCSVGEYADGGCLVELHIPEGDFSAANTLFEVLEVLWRRQERERRKAAKGGAK